MTTIPLSSPGPWMRGGMTSQATTSYPEYDILDTTGAHVGLVSLQPDDDPPGSQRNEALALDAPVLLAVLIGAADSLTVLIDFARSRGNGNAARLASEIRKTINDSIAPHVECD